MTLNDSAVDDCRCGGESSWGSKNPGLSYVAVEVTGRETSPLHRMNTRFQSTSHTSPTFPRQVTAPNFAPPIYGYPAMVHVDWVQGPNLQEVMVSREPLLLMFSVREDSGDQECYDNKSTPFS